MSNGKKDNSVQDGKLTDEQLGGLTRRVMEIVKRINQKILKWKDVMDVLQLIIIENKTFEHLGVLKGTHRIIPADGVVDCSTLPNFPDDDLGHTIESHNPGGKVILQKYEQGLLVDTKFIELYVSERQKSEKGLRGAYLQVELENKKVLNATLLVYLLNNPQYIPDDWKKEGVGIYFWGTIYRDNCGNLMVRYLYWHSGEDKWEWDSQGVADMVVKCDVSAVLND